MPTICQRLPIVVLVSGRGSNLQALIDAQMSGDLPIEIRAVISEQPQALALERADRAGIPTVVVERKDFPDRPSFDHALAASIAQFNPELVVLAGFMRILGEEVISVWKRKLINVHPSLLPKYPGLNTHQRALEAGDSEHGASVHFVTQELDGGPIISQIKMPILPQDTPETLAQRLLPLEHRLLCATVRLFTEQGVVLSDKFPLLLGDDSHWLPNGLSPGST